MYFVWIQLPNALDTAFGFKKNRKTIRLRIFQIKMLNNTSLFINSLNMMGTRASQSALAIGRHVPNMGGLSISKKKLLSSVVSSKLLYALTSWTKEATRTAKNRAAMARP
jgi:hypothetical protein